MFIFALLFFALSEFELTPEIVENEKQIFAQLENKVYDLFFKGKNLIQVMIDNEKLSKIKDFEKQINQIKEEISKLPKQMHEQSPNSKLYIVNLSISQIISQGGQMNENDLNHKGLFVFGKNPQIRYIPYYRHNKPSGLITVPSLDETCNPADLYFTFYHDQIAYPTIKIEPSTKLNLFKTSNIDHFDELVVKVETLNQQSSFTCIPEFIIYTEQN